MSRMIWCWLWRSQWWNFCRFKWAENLTWRLKREPKNLQPRQTELPPHLVNSSLKLILHFIKRSSASGNSWLEVCNWDILENTHTFRKESMINRHPAQNHSSASITRHWKWPEDRFKYFMLWFKITSSYICYLDQDKESFLPSLPNVFTNGP